MPVNITMPALSPTMEEGTLAKWFVKPGDSVTSGDLIAEIETDKATMEVEAVDEGVVAHILVDAGAEGVKVNEIIAVLAEDGEDPKAISVPSATTAAPAPQPVAAAAPSVAAQTTAPKAIASTPLPSNGDRVVASPLAKRIAKMKGIDLSHVKGSGPRGRIIKRDVEYIAPGSTPAAPTSAQAGPPKGLILPQVLDDRIYAPESYRLEPLDNVRKTVAKRLTESFMQIPHFPLTIDLELDPLLASRKAINAAAPEGVKVSVNDMLIKAAALALIEEPDCNASYSDNGIAYHKGAHVSVAVAIDGGLITPVIRDAEKKGLQQISIEMKDLATRARERKLKPQEYMGGTFSLSNLGMFGIKSFASIINPPEGMILSVGAGEKRPVVAANGDIEVRTIMSVTLTCDHRVIGGAEGAKWLAAFKRFTETPEAMLL